MSVQIRFHGATREVTGSMHLIEVDGYKIALDCGLHQGKRKESIEKNKSFPCPPDQVDAVILSHAHIDHCGKLPRLVAEGFNGPIFATPATGDMVAILLADSAHIQEEDAEYWNKKRVKRGDDPIEPLYTADDVEDTVKLLHQRRLGITFEVVPGVRATLHEAGHMLGSSHVLLEIDNGRDTPIRVVYSGDLGRSGIDILRDPVPFPVCDYLICESTYGGRETSAPEDMGDELASVINETIDRGGKLIVPCFAVGRTQVLIYTYQVLVLEGKIKQIIPMIVDSPLAVKATEIFRNHPEIFDTEASAFNSLTKGIFDWGHLEYTQSVEESKALNQRHESMIILSASGMCEAGRILHHLKNNVEDPKNTILMVGYQAAHTLGRRIMEKQKQVKIFGDFYQLKAQVRSLNGFSAHANGQELIDAVRPLKGKTRKVFLVHGEAGQQDAMAERLRAEGFNDVHVPQRGEVYTLGGE